MKKLALACLFLVFFSLCTDAALSSDKEDASSLKSISSEVLINELVPNPTDDCLDCTEWVELYNAGEESVNLTGWQLSDSTDHYVYLELATLEPDSLVLEPDSYLVASNFSYGFRLRNDGDTITLSDADGSVVDQTSYSSFSTDEAWARVPNGEDSWIKIASTPGEFNQPEDEPDDESESDEDKENNDEDTNDAESTDVSVSKDSSKNTNNDAPVSKENNKELAGETVYVSSQKKDLTTPLLLFLICLLVIIVALQLQLLSMRKGR